MQNRREGEIPVLDKGFVRLVDHMGDDAAIVQAARVSYGPGTKSVSEDEALIRYLMRHRHTSPFEMVEFKFHCKMPIFVARQWIRHRTASVNEISGRYSEMPNDFYVPEEDVFTKQNPSNKQGGTSEKISVFNVNNPDDWWECISPEHIADGWNWGEHFKDEQELARNQYERWLGTGVRRELARINLPLSQYTEWYWKIDLHNLLHFLKLRLDEHAQYEIRVYAESILSLIEPIVPMTVRAFQDYVNNALTFSSREQLCLRMMNERLCASPEEVEQIVENIMLNKREKEEFLDKVKTIWGKRD